MSLEKIQRGHPEFTIKYAVLDSSIIFNALSPDFLMKRHNKTAEAYVDELNARNGFYEKLEDSILREGFRNPIMVSAGWFPSKMARHMPQAIIDNPKDHILCLTNGGSRLWIAQKHKMRVPCIISDYVDMFPKAEILNTEDEIMAHYSDKPSRILHGAKGLSARDLPHVHLIGYKK